MQDENKKASEPEEISLGVPYTVAIVCLAVVALVGTYFLAQSSYEGYIRTGLFAGMVITFLVSTVALHYWYSPASREFRDEASESQTDRRLQALDDAHEFFAGSLRGSDAFRLVASRVRDMLEFRTLTLHLVDATRMRFRAAESDGPDAEHRRGRFSDLIEGPISRAYYSQVIEIDHATTSTRPSVAIPLKNGSEVFGVLHLDFEMNFDPSNLDLFLLDAIGTRSGSLIQSSLCYEQSQTNALTDSVTELPNERAFFMMVESQVAESQRKGSSRPLTILTLDVISFDEINNRFGHAAGDRVLSFVAQIVKDNLRQMDFLARASADEFLVVLPTASKEISHDVIARVQTGFFGRKLKVTETESIEIELNIGWAAFGSDGETPETLLRVARERKAQTKSSLPHKIVWFPNQFAN